MSIIRTYLALCTFATSNITSPAASTGLIGAGEHCEQLVKRKAVTGPKCLEKKAFVMPDI
jgi:hypothetical protein